MLRIKIVAVGKLKERALTETADDYAKRLSRYCSIEIIEVADESISAHESNAVIVRRLGDEARRVLDRVKAGAYVVALDMSGDAPDSVGFSKQLASLSGLYPEIVFIIGGSHGLHADVLARADYVLSLSKLTFPHRLARLILLEQLYRAFKIINGETYHK